MKLKIIGFAVFIIIIIALLYYYFTVYAIESQFVYKPGLDNFGQDMPLVNSAFISGGGKTIRDAMKFALGRADVVGFVRLNGGAILFKSTRTPTNPPCIDRICTDPTSGFYAKK